MTTVDEEWTTVNSSRKGKSHRGKHGTTTKSSNKVEKAVEVSQALLNSSSNTMNREGTQINFISMIEKTKEILKRSSFYESIVSNALLARKEHTVTGITALGIGSVVQNCSWQNPSVWQFAFLLLIRDCLFTKLPSDGCDELIPVTCFEPHLTSADEELCNHYRITVMKSNTRGFCSPCCLTNNGSFHYYYMPHCPYRLYCNVLWSHWDELHKIAIIGNSFASYEIRRMSMDSPSSSNTSTKDNTDLVAIVSPFTKESLLSPTSQSNKIDKDIRSFLETAFCELSFQTFPCCHEEDVKENIVKPSREQMELATDKDCEVR